VFKEEEKETCLKHQSISKAFYLIEWKKSQESQERLKEG